MTIHRVSMGQGHDIIVFKVKRWWKIYRYFNILFARANRRIELMIDDGTCTYYYE